MSAPEWTSKGATGAASELRACVHLMEQGWHVYRCESPNAPFDLVAYRDGAMLRVEVKSLSRKSEDHYTPSFGWPVNDEWDLLIVAGPDVIFEFRQGVTKEETRAAIIAHYGLYPRDGSNGVVPLVVELLEQEHRPGVTWTPRAVEAELRRRGWQPSMAHPRRAVATALLTLFNQRALDRPRHGEYVWRVQPEPLTARTAAGGGVSA